ncbi:LPD38 domain-containing protein [Plesiomonas shigelloides]|uniref:LPD38 domain-containing protein n=1 Tax=Plesiomonas shigelloides TaxID=703 RepID=UPI003EB698CB
MRNDEKNGMPSPVMSDTRMDDFWNNLDANLLATPSQAAAEPKDLSVGFGDAVKAVGAGALDLVGGIGEVARQASAFGKKNGDGNPELSYADQASARMAKRLSPVLDVVAGVGNKAHETSAALVDSMSDDAKEALNRSIISENERGGLTLGDGAGDIDVWALKFANGLGSMLPTLATGGITGAAAKMTLGRAVTTSMLKRGASKEIAEAVAAKAVEKLATGAAGTTAITGSAGSAGLNAKETINAMSFDELRDSSSFREAFLRIDGDQQYQGLSDFEKLSMARDEVANLASAATMGDVKTWGAAAAGSLLGDTMLFKMLAGKGAKGFIAGAAKGAAGEGIGEMLEEGTQQYAVNQAVSNTTGIESDPWKGVLSSALEGGLIGAGTGGALGAVGGTRASLAERKAKSAEKQQNEDNAKEQAQSQEQDVPSSTSQTAQAEEQAKVVEGAQPAIDTIAETVKPAPEVNAAETQVQAIDDSVTGTSGFDEFADIPTFVRNAADREQFPNTDAQVQAFRDQFDSEREPAKLRGTLDKSELRQPTDDSEMGVSSGQFDAFRDVPASRIRGVPNENSAVQQVLAGKREVNSPEGWHPNVRKALAGEYGAQVRDMIAAQIKAGNQGATQAELDARKPFDNKVDRELNQVAVYKPMEGEVIPAEADKPSDNQAGLPRGDLNADYTEIIPESHRIGKSDVIYANGAVSQSADGNSAYVPPVLARNQPDTSMDTQSVRDPRSEVAKAIKRAGTDTDSVFGPLKTLRITRRGKPFSSQKEAQLASRKGIETPVELNGGGYGVASIAEVEQAKAAMPNQETTANAVPANGRPSPNEPIESSQPQLTPANDAGVSVSGRAAAYSRNGIDGSGSQTKGMSKKEVELIAKGFVREYKGAANLLVKVVQTQEEANKLTLGGLPDGYKVHAFYQGNGIGRVVLVADNLTSAKHTLEKLRHEILVHHGFQAVIGDAEYDRILQVLWEARQSPALKPLWEQIQEVERDTPLEGQLEELLAYVAEQPRGPIRKLCDRIVGMIAHALRKVGFINRVTKAELRNIVEAIGDRMKAVAIYADSETGAAVSDKGASGGHVLKGSMTKFSREKTAQEIALEKLNLGPRKDPIKALKERIDEVKSRPLEQWKEMADAWMKRMNAATFDALAPLKYAEDKVGNIEASDSAYIAARLATGSASTMHGAMLYGVPEWKDGIVQMKQGTSEKDSFLGIFESVGSDLHTFLGWIAGNRAKRLKAEGRENLLTDEDIDALISGAQGKEAKFEDARKRLMAMNDALLDIAEDAGLISRADRKQWQDNDWYIPFYREDDDGDVMGPWKQKRLAGQRAMIKKLKGGKQNTNDLLENILVNASKLIDSSMKNMAMQKAVWNLAETDVIEVISKPNLMDIKAAMSPKGNKSLLSMKMEGEDYVLRIHDEQLFKALTAIDQQRPDHPGLGLARAAKRLLTATVTAMPDFMLRNFIRDAMQAWTIDKNGFKFGLDSLRGIKKTWREEGGTLDMLFAGGSFMGGYMNDTESMASSIRRALRKKGMTPEQIAKYERSLITSAIEAKERLAGAWEKYRSVGDAIENANREAVYDAAIRAGKSKAEAIFEAKDLMDFSMMGNARLMMYLSDILPFFNARMQGLSKLGRSIRDNPKLIAQRGGAIALASVGLALLNADDERYEELPDNEKDLYWHIFLGDEHFRIPKPFEIGVMFGTIPERMTRTFITDNDSGKKLAERIMWGIGETLSMNPVPQVVKPGMEVFFNYDMFRAASIESMSDLNVRPEARYNENTSETLRAVGDMTGMSPKKMEHLVRGYFGTLGMWVMGIADMVTRNLSSAYGDAPAWRKDDIAIVGSFYRGNAPAKSTQFMTEFYDVLQKAEQLNSTVRQYRQEGRHQEADAILSDEKNMILLRQRKPLTGIQKQIRQLKAQIELVQRDRSLSPAEKRERIDRMMAARNKLVSQAVKMTRTAM